MTLPQMFAGILGGTLCLASLFGFISKKTRRFKALFWFAVGLVMGYAAMRPSMIEMLGDDTSELRLRLVVFLLSLIVISATLESIRVSKMQERYAFLWLLTGGALVLGAAWGDLAVIVAKLTGMSYGASVLVVIFSFVLFMLFHLCVALSSLQHNLARSVRALALTEERLRSLESRGDAQ